MKIELINQTTSYKGKTYELAFKETDTPISTGIEVGYFELNMHLDLEEEGYHYVKIWFSKEDNHIIQSKYIVVYVDNDDDRIENFVYRYNGNEWVLSDDQPIPERKPDQTIDMRAYKKV